MKFKDLNLKLGSKLLWKTNRVFDYWIGEVVEISKSYISITWRHISSDWEQTTKYFLNTLIFDQIVYDEPEFAEYLNLFRQEQVLS